MAAVRIHPGERVLQCAGDRARGRGYGLCRGPCLKDRIKEGWPVRSGPAVSEATRREPASLLTRFDALRHAPARSVWPQE
jgi:hypothetical protein